MDYGSTTVNLLFNAGISRACALIPIVNDNFDENDEIFDVTLTTSDDEIRLAPDQSMVIITDNDSKFLPQDFHKVL